MEYLAYLIYCVNFCKKKILMYFNIKIIIIINFSTRTKHVLELFTNYHYIILFCFFFFFV